MKPNLGDVLADKYRLDRVLGEGGMSMVFAAVNLMTGKQVAIKWLQPEIIADEEQSQRLLREAQATSAIDHPNVVNVFDVGRHGGALFLVMELLHGEPLSELLARGSHDPHEFVALMMPVLRGVQAAHRMGVVHRDLKPDNIFLCCDPLNGETREPKVLDFGISKLADDMLEPGRELTKEGTVFGTPQYMAPEQMRDAHIADARADVYALGVIFYRALSCSYPYDADTLTALAIRIVEGNAKPLHELCPHVDPGLSSVIMRALALDPEQRYPSVAAFGHALEPYANGVSFTPATRDSSPGLARDSQPPLRPSMSLRVSQPPSLPANTLRRLPAELVVAPANDDGDDHPMIDVSDDDPTIVGSRFSLPPPPPHSVAARPSRGLELTPPRISQRLLPTERIPQVMPEARSSRRLALGAALFLVGTLLPVGVKLFKDMRTAEATGALVTKSEPSAQRHASLTRPELAIDTRVAEAARPMPSAPPPLVPHGREAPELPVESAHAASAEQPRLELVEPARPRKRSLRATNPEVRAVQEESSRESNARSEEPEPARDTPALEQLDRNPYLLHK